MSDQETIYLRVPPREPRKGYVIRKLTYRGRQFDAGVWFQVTKDLAQDMLKMRQPSGMPMFEQATEEEARNKTAVENDLNLKKVFAAEKLDERKLPPNKKGMVDLEKEQDSVPNLGMGINMEDMEDAEEYEARTAPEEPAGPPTPAKKRRASKRSSKRGSKRKAGAPDENAE